MPRHPILASLVLVTAIAPLAACADELAAQGSARAIVIHDAVTTLRDFCARDEAGRMWITLPGGARFELITSTDDPGIANPGDGAFHTFEPAEVRAALAAVRFPLGGVAADVFILPYPRRGQVESAAGPALILLSPGVRPLSRDHQHAEFAHELGHVVQYARMPDGDARWDDYKSLRAIGDPSRYSAASRHADRPHEIFAEDFRALFGGAAANYSGTIENDALAPPDQVQGLASFLLELSNAPRAVAFAANPNPTRGATRFSLEGATPTPLDVFDAAGRRVATLEARQTWNGVVWSFGGFDPHGRRVLPGVLYARPRGIAGAGARVVVLP